MGLLIFKGQTLVATNKSTRRVRKLRESSETVRERASGTRQITERPSRVRAVTSRIGSLSIWKPFKAAGRFLAKYLVPPYFKNSWRELKLVTWPNRKQTRQLTFAVIVFSIVFGAVVALLDYGLDKLFKKVILNI
jgi:preprotein translocase SecE subunit